MKEKKIKMYLKECTSKLEFIENKKLIRLHNKVKLKQFKKLYNFFLKIFINIKFLFNVISVNLKIEVFKEESLLCIIPINIDKIKNKNKSKFINYLYKKCIRNIEKIINKYNVNIVILSKKVKKMQEIKNLFNYNKIDILDGKYLFKIMILNVLEYILSIKNEKLETQNIYVAINKNSEINVNLLEYIASKVKCLNIITKQIKSFGKLERFLYEKKGIMVVISNNKKKSLKKANIIINFDMEQNMLNKYQINRDTIIINLSNNNIKMQKSFNGIIINSMKINNIKYKIRNYYLFENIDLYESDIIQENKFSKMLDKIKFDNIKIKHLLGGRGKIQNMEYKKIA